MASLFEQSPSDWTLRELQVGAAAVAEAADRALLAEDRDCAIRLQALALVLAAERDARVALHRAMDDAALSAVVTDLGPC